MWLSRPRARYQDRAVGSAAISLLRRIRIFRYRRPHIDLKASRMALQEPMSASLKPVLDHADIFKP